MKKITLIIACIATSISMGIMGCTSMEKKTEKAEEKVVDAKVALAESQAKAAEAATQEAFVKEWEIYQMESEWAIRKNDSAIVNLKAANKKAVMQKNSSYEKQITELKEKNEALKTKLNAYDKNRENWNSFKTEFSHDMNQLGEAFKGLVIKTK